MKVIIDISYNDKDISESINKYLESLSYTDFAHGKKDDLHITLDNKSGKWTNGWFPHKGAKLKFNLIFNETKLNPGIFTIDDVSASEPPSIFKMKAVSSVDSSGKKDPAKINGLNTRQKRTHENISLGEVVSNIAKYHGLKHVYSVDKEILIERVSQDESDLTFLKNITNEYGLKLKLQSEKIIVYSGKKYEEKPPTLVIEKGVSNIESCSFNSKAHDTYSSVILLYQNIDDKSPEKFRWSPPGTDIFGEVLALDRGSMTTEKAEELAKNVLRKKNESSDTGNMKLLGNPLLRAGINLDLIGFGVFSGKYFIEEAKHDIGSSYVTSIKIRKVLEY